MKARRWFVAGFALLNGCGADLPPPTPFAGLPSPLADAAGPRRFVVVGDTQPTSWLEFWRESNDAERRIIAEEIVRTPADFVLFTGDLIFDGGSPTQWHEFDTLYGELAKMGRPAYAAFGNHELWKSRASGEESLWARFPHQRPHHWFTVPVGALQIIVLDSNFSEMTDAARTDQASWFRKELGRLDSAPEVKGVFVSLHHPAYSNSDVTGDEEAVIGEVLPAFQSSPKTMALLSGHAHAYERFLRGEKMLIVSGGGGGPRVTLTPRHPDLCCEGLDRTSRRPFHFSVYSITDRGVSVIVRGVDKGGATFRNLDAFELPWPASK